MLTNDVVSFELGPVHAQDDLNLCILHMLEGSSICSPHMIFAIFTPTYI